MKYTHNRQYLKCDETIGQFVVSIFLPQSTQSKNHKAHYKSFHCDLSENPLCALWLSFYYNVEQK